MKILTDENISNKLIYLLREEGHDVLAAIEEFRTISDNNLINIAKRERRILLTLDKDFANIITYPPKDYCGIIRIRIHPPFNFQYMANLKIHPKNIDY